MKKRDITLLVVAVLIVIVTLALIYRYIIPPPKDTGITVIVPHPVDPNFNQQQLDTLKNKTTDFSADITPKDSGNKPIIQ
jgi:hypothetical protein